jgi:hypothetical protein
MAIPVPWRVCGALAAVLALAALYVVAAWRFPFHGFWHDDGIYVQLGRSLHEGSYRLAQLPGEPLQARYPPLLPALLSLVWSAGGDARATFWPFCIPGALAAAAGTLLWHRYLRVHEAARPAWALACTAAAALSPLAFLLCGCVMAEPLCLLLYPAAFLALGDGRAPRRAAGAGALLGLAMLARQAAVAPWLGAALALALGGRWRSAAALGATGLACVAPWWAWVAITCAFRPAEAAPVCDYYVHYHHVVPAGLADVATILPARAEDLAVACAAPFAGALLLPEVAPALGGAGRVASALLAIAFLAGLGRRLRRGCTPARLALLAGLASLLLYPYATWRFLVPWAPFAALLAAQTLAGTGSVRALLLLCFAAANLGVTTAFALQPGAPGRARVWRETLDVAPHHELVRFVRAALPRDAVLACDYDPFYWWATGRRAVMIADFDPVALVRGASYPDLADACLREHAALGVTHVLTNPRLEVPVARWLAAWERAGILREVHADASGRYRVLAVQQAARTLALRAAAGVVNR